MTKIALLVGVSEYEPGLNPLPAAVKDIEAMRRVLSAPDLGGFDEVKALGNLDSQTMQYEFETLFSGRSKDDLVVLFFSGHGIKDDSGRLYFAARNTQKNAKNELIRSTAVPASFLHEVMNGSRAKRQAIILDCCFSGAFDPALIARDDSSVDLQGQLGAEGRVVLTSSSSTQYSFEEQGSDLSIYTRYLVEGIETGAGDLGEDGKVSMRELHEYAASKVRETAPGMTPKMITLKDMGFEIVLAKAKIADPKLSYRRQVDRYASRGKISNVGRTILDTLRFQLGLSTEDTSTIEDEVLQPYRKRLENFQRYRQVFVAAIEYEYPLSDATQTELRDLCEILGLRGEDVSLIEAEETVKKTAAAQEAHSEKLQRYQQEFQKAIQAEYPFSEYVKSGLLNLQQSLGLKNEDVAQTERSLIKQKEVELRQQQEEKLRREEIERQQQKEEQGHLEHQADSQPSVERKILEQGEEQRQQEVKRISQQQETEQLKQQEAKPQSKLERTQEVVDRISPYQPSSQKSEQRFPTGQQNRSKLFIGVGVLGLAALGTIFALLPKSTPVPSISDSPVARPSQSPATSPSPINSNSSSQPSHIPMVSPATTTAQQTQPQQTQPQQTQPQQIQPQQTQQTKPQQIQPQQTKPQQVITPDPQTINVKPPEPQDPVQSRTRWEQQYVQNNNLGMNIFVNTSPGVWEENDHGVAFSFTETSRTSDYVELYDASRDFYQRLKEGGWCFKNPGDPKWYCGSGGRWTQ